MTAIPVLLLALLTFGSPAGADWASNYGGISLQSAYTQAQAVDASGNVYIAGNFSGATFTLGSMTLTKIGTQDTFVAKLDSSGTVLWAKNYGGGGAYAYGQSIAVDGSGNVYLGGYFYNASLTTPSLTKIGFYDAFAIKLNSSGITTWAKNFGGLGATAYGNSIAVDGSGNVYLGGSFAYDNLTTPSLTKIGSDAFAIKLDSSGNITWAKNFGGSGATAYGNSIAVDGSGNVYLGGTFTANLTTPALTKIGSYDAFAIKLNSSGITTWAKNFGGIGATAYGNSIAVDGSGNVYLGGYFNGANLTTPALTKIGGSDAFAIKLDSTGATTWAKNYGGANAYGQSIAVDGSGNVYLGGYFQSGNLTTPVLTKIGTSDAFAFKLDSSGNITWAKNFGGSGATAYGNSIAVDGSGNVYLGGTFTANLTTPALTKIGSQDAFAIKLDSTGATTWAKNYGSLSPAAARINATAVDTVGNVYITGYFTGSLLTMGSVTLTRIGSADAFVAKLDASGTVLWAKNYGGNVAYASGNSIAVDGSGNVYLGGYFQSGNLTTPALTKIGNNDAFAIKLNSSGTTIWAKNYGGSGATAICKSIAVDGSGNVYLGGYFYNASLTTPSLTKIGTQDAFAIKLDSTGATTWAKNYGGANAYGQSIAVDGSGNVYLGGYFQSGNLTTPVLTKIGTSDAFAFKLDSSGNTTWAKNYGGSGATAHGKSIAVDGSGNVYLGGYFYNASLTTPSLTKIGWTDAFAIKVDPSGNTVWAKNFGGSNAYALGNSIAVDGSGNVYLGGYFQSGNLTTPALRKIGTYDVFALKLDSSGTTTWTENYGGSGATAYGESIAVDGSGNIYIGGYFSGSNLTIPALTKIGNEDAYILAVTPLPTDTTPPTGSISINSGAASTTSTSATLTLSCTDTSGCAEMQFSNDNSNWSTAEAYATSKAWTLSTGDGTKTIYVKFKDTAGNWSTATISDTIVLDTTAPTTTASPAGGTYTSAQSVTLTCNDGAGSGCDKIYYTTDGTTPTTSSTVYSTPVSITATTTLKFFAKDLAGNSETVKTATYTIDTLDTWVWKNPVPQGNPLYGVTYGNSTFVAVGIYGTILTSPDGFTWTPRTSGVTNGGLLAVTYGNSKFVAVGYGGTILTSPDGISWTSRTSGITNGLRAVTYDNSKFVAVGDSGTILTSSDGISWNLRTSGVVYDLCGVSYGNFTFVAVGFSGTILTSPDGISWTLRTSGTSNDLKAITYSNSKFVAVGNLGTILTSPDGVTWTSRTSGTVANFNGIAYGSAEFIAVAENGNIMTSPDGVTWGYTAGGGSRPLYGVIFGDFTSTYVIIGDGGLIMTTPDGNNPVYREGSNHDFMDIAYANSTFVATTDWGNFFLSSNGANWGQLKIGNNARYDITYGNSTFVAVSGGGAIETSPDGYTWTSRTSGVTSDLYGVTYGNSIFVAVGYGGKIITSSTDGVTWTLQTSGTTSDLYSVTYGNSIFVAVGYGGKILTSPDGVTWTSRSYVTTDSLYGVTWGNSTFVAVGNRYVIHTSPDGVNWTLQWLSGSAGSPVGFNDVIYGNSTFVAVGDGGKIITSADGNTWTSRTSGTVNDLNGIAFGNSSFIAVGPYGTILQSGTADTTAPTTTASPAGGTYTSAQSVTLTCSDGAGSGCDKIYYTTDGSTPTTLSTVYATPITVSSTTTIKFFAKDLAGNSEAVKTEAYTINLADTTPPSAPSNIEVNNPGVKGELVVSWTNPADSDFSHIHIYRSTISGTLGTLIADNITGIKHKDTGLASLTIYYYTVKAVDAAGNESTNTAQVSAKTSDATPPGVPITVSASDDGTGGKINLSWTNPADTDFSQIKVYRSTASGTLGNAVCIVSKPTASCSDTGLTNGTTYYYTVRAVDTSSNETTNTTQVSAIPTAPDMIAPGIPGNLTVTDTQAGGTLTVSWTNPVDADFNHIHIYRSTTLGVLGTLVLDNVTAASATNTGLTNNATYYYTVRSVDNSGNESTNTNQAYEMPTDVAPPMPVSNLTATLLSGGQVRLDWIRSASTDVNYYNIYYDNGTGTINYASTIGSVAHPTTTWTSGALTAETAYKFAVRVKDTSPLEETNTNVVVNVVPVSNPETSGVRAYVSSPVTGQKIGGSRVTVAAGLLTGARTEVKDIRFQYKPVSSGSWTDMTTADAGYPNPDTTEPWYIYWNASGLTNGDYLLRAVATNTSLATDSSPSYITVAVDNAAPEAAIETINAQSEPVKQQDVSVNTTNNLTVGSESGVIILTIPETALSSDTEVNVTVADPVVRSISIPSDYKTGDVFLEITLDSGQTSLENNKEAVITVPYKDDDDNGYVDGTGSPGTLVYDLKVMWYNTTAGAWEKLDSTVDTATKTVRATTNHFSLFGLLAPPNPTTPGWNIVSVPLQPVPNDATSVFGQTPYVWDPTAQGYVRPSTVSPGTGYWIQGGSNLTATGTETPTTGDFSITLKKGWNMIGNPFRFKVRASDIKVNYNSTEYTMTQAEANGIVVGTFYPYINGAYQFVNASDGGELEPWVGYWILSDKDCTLLVPPTGQ